MRDRINNAIVDITTFIRKNSYLFFPLLSLLFVFLIKFFNILSVNIDADLRNNIVNVSGVLSGFLFTTYGIFMSLPDNNFIKYLKASKHFDVIYKVLLFGIIFLISSMIFGIFKIFDKAMIITFVIGMTEVVISVYYFYMITSLSYKSN